MDLALLDFMERNANHIIPPCQSVAEVLLTGVASLGAVSHD